MELNQDRTQRARELKSQGKKIFGYLNTQPVLEMLTALDIVPYAIMGDMNDTITAADKYLPTMVCPFLRSVLDQGLKGKYDFLDGAFFAHSCEVGEKIAHMWRIYMKPEFEHYIDTPHTTHASAIIQHRKLLEDAKSTLEKFTGKQITGPNLSAAIKLHNDQRALVRKLYDLSKSDPPQISGGELIHTMLALTGLPVQEGSTLLKEVIEEVSKRKNGPAGKPARLLVWGSIMDNSTLIDLIEETGANVVIDDTDMGSRPYFKDVSTKAEPMTALAEHYLIDLRSPRTFLQTMPRGGKKDYMADLDERFSYLKDYIAAWKVNGLILEVLRYCDSHSYEVPGLRDYFEKENIPVLFVEHDYSAATVGQLRTRVQGFLEIIG